MEALLVIDIQPETVKLRSAEPFIQKWNDIISSYDSNVIAYIANLRPFSKIPKENPFAEGLDVVSDNIFFKRIPNAFSNSALIRWLEEIGADSVRLVGIDGNWCIKATALGAVKHGYETHVVKSAVVSQNRSAFEGKTVEKLRRHGVQVD